MTHAQMEVELRPFQEAREAEAVEAEAKRQEDLRLEREEAQRQKAERMKGRGKSVQPQRRSDSSMRNLYVRDADKIVKLLKDNSKLTVKKLALEDLVKTKIREIKVLEEKNAVLRGEKNEAVKNLRDIEKINAGLRETLKQEAQDRRTATDHLGRAQRR